MNLFRPLVITVFAFGLLQPLSADQHAAGKIRFASFNIAMGLENEGALYQRLQAGDDPALEKVAAVVQRVRPDVLLINEFDAFELDSTWLFIKNYLDIPQSGNEAISYAHTLNGAVNTGWDSGLDLDGNGRLGDAADAWGFGSFPGQYGMTVLSKFPLSLQRSFRHFKWADMPGALLPVNPDGSPWYPDEVSKQLRLSSKSHWDIAVSIGGRDVHFLVSHPTPPVFDGPEDRNGRRNHDEIRFWADYVHPERSGYIYDDTGLTGGLQGGARFVIAGDLNADPEDGDSSAGAIQQLLGHPLVEAGCNPTSEGGRQASELQGGVNRRHRGDPAADTADFNDEYTGNMRIDYVLPSKTLKVTGCGVFWPAAGEDGHELAEVSDHHLVWLDIEL